MKQPESNALKILLLTGVTVVTLGVHYGWLVEPLFGHVHWIHAVHGRFCYIPIVMAASWFGLRGGLYAATAISALVLPYVFLFAREPHDYAGEFAEIVFYFAIAILIGVLVEREFRARRRQQEAQVRAERSHELSLVGQVAAGVAHEIKNPLASIRGAADILADDDTSPEAKNEFRTILRNETRRIDTTVSEFLAFARPKETRLERLELGPLLEMTTRQVRAEAGRRGVGLETRIDDGVFVDGDAEKLHQMTLNLILNAIQACGEGGAVSLRLEPGPSAARIVVRDDGSGIAPDDLAHVFEPFYTTRSTGTGLGLAIVKDIVEAHSGTIGIDSRKGAGTTVTVTLPLYEESKENQSR